MLCYLTLHTTKYRFYIVKLLLRDVMKTFERCMYSLNRFLSSVRRYNQPFKRYKKNVRKNLLNCSNDLNSVQIKRSFERFYRYNCLK